MVPGLVGTGFSWDGLATNSGSDIFLIITDHLGGEVAYGTSLGKGYPFYTVFEPYLSITKIKHCVTIC